MKSLFPFIALCLLFPAPAARASWCGRLIAAFSPAAPPFAETRREAIESVLRKSWLWPWRHLRALPGDSEPQLYRLAGGMKAVKKTRTFYGARLTNDPERELTVYGIDRFFRLAVVPPIVRREDASLQYYVEPGELDGRQSDPVGYRRALFLRRILVREGDRKFETVTGRDGKLWAIDFGLDEAEPVEVELTRGEVLSSLPDRATYEYLKTLDRAAFRARFGPYAGDIYYQRIARVIAVAEDEIRSRGYAAVFPI